MTSKRYLAGVLALLLLLACALPASAATAVTGVRLDRTTLTLVEGATATLRAIVSPSSATDKAVTWKSSNAAVVKVSTAGKLTGVKAGTATITVTTKSKGKTASCKVTVQAAKNAQGTTNGNCINYSLMAQEGSTVFFAVRNNVMENGIYAMNDAPGASAKARLIHAGDCSELNAIGGWLYFTKDDAFWRIKQNGTGLKKLRNHYMKNVLVVGGMVYGVSLGDDEGALVRFKLDGSGYKVLQRSVCGSLSVRGTSLYYIDYDDKNRVYTIGTGGGGRKRIGTRQVSNALVGEDGYLYYTEYPTGHLYRSNLDGTGEKNLAKLPVAAINYIDGYLYYKVNTSVFRMQSGTMAGLQIGGLKSEANAYIALSHKFLLTSSSSGSPTTIFCQWDYKTELDAPKETGATVTAIRNNFTYTSLGGFNVNVVTGGHVEADIKMNSSGQVTIKYGFGSNTWEFSMVGVGGATYTITIPVTGSVGVGSVRFDDFTVSTGSSKQSIPYQANMSITYGKITVKKN